jgi:hypothetical protein
MSEENKVLSETEQQSLSTMQKKIDEMLNLNNIKELIRSNEQIFEYNGITYRVRKPTYKQRQEAYTKRIEKYTELLKNDKYLLEEDLKKTYLKRNINVETIANDMQNLIVKRDDLMLKLGELLKNGAPDSDLNLLKQEIEDLNDRISVLAFKRTSLLEFSIEQQVMMYTYSYFTFLLSEKKEGENWVRVWNKFEDFEVGEDVLISKLTYYVTIMSNSEIQV